MQEEESKPFIFKTDCVVEFQFTFPKLVFVDIDVTTE